jgi:hypothetical protein
MRSKVEAIRDPAHSPAQKTARRAVRPGERRALLLWESPISSGLMALAVYFLLALGHGSSFHASPRAYYNYLADAFLHGQLDLRLIPADTLDLSYFQGQYFLYWPPLPAILLMPFVALFGVQFSDIIFTLVIGALNVSLVALLLRGACRRGIIRLSKLRRGILVAFFALGTVHLVLAPYGRVWFTGQLVGFSCVALAYLTSISLRGAAGFTLTGLAIAAALLTRNHLVLAGLWPALFLLWQHRSDVWLRVFIYSLTALSPVLLTIGLLGVYDWMRFGSVFDNGIVHHLMHPAFAADYQTYGYFSLHYVPINFFYQYIAYPLPIRSSSQYGGSLFLLSPLFFAAFWSLKRDSSWSTWILIFTVVLTSIPILLLMGTGSFQFGPRYTLDFTVPLLMLTAIGSHNCSISTMIRLTLISIAHYSIGAFLFMKYMA